MTSPSRFWLKSFSNEKTIVVGLYQSWRSGTECCWWSLSAPSSTWPYKSRALCLPPTVNTSLLCRIIITLQHSTALIFSQPGSNLSHSFAWKFLIYLARKIKTTSILYLAEEFGHSLSAKDQKPCSALPFPFSIAISKNCKMSKLLS